MSQDYDVTFALSTVKIPRLQQRHLLQGYEDRIVLYNLLDGVDDTFDHMLCPAEMADLCQTMEDAQIRLCEGLVSARGAGQVRDLSVKFSVQTIHSTPVHMVICDSMLYIPFEVCKKRGIPCHVFNAASAKLVTGILKVTAKTTTRTEEEYCNGEEASEDVGFTIEDKCLTWMLRLNSAWPLATSIINNSVEELEEEAIVDFTAESRLARTKVYFVGPLIPEMNAFLPVSENLADRKVDSWLDDQEAKSVVYVSFGTLSLMTPEQIREIAVCLLSLQAPFIWSLRESEHRYLPEDMLEKMRRPVGRKATFLILSWVSQKRILSHPSTGVFVSHCGWNSTLESIFYGVAVVAWPMFADQYMNADFLVAHGAAVKIKDTGLQSKKLTSAVELRYSIARVYCSGDTEDGDSFLTNISKLRLAVATAVSPGGSSFRHLKNLLKWDPQENRVPVF